MRDPKSYPPMLQQYLNVKQHYPDCFVLFRVGDFYELFFEDACLASSILNIVLTKIGKGSDSSKEAEMCGIPAHACDAYLYKLVKHRKVAICEQSSDKDGKLFKREVVRIVTAGTITEEMVLSNLVSNNFIISLHLEEDKYYLAIADISTGDFLLDIIKYSEHALNLYCSKLNPAELLMTSSIFNMHQLSDFDEVVTQLKNHTKMQLQSVISSEFLNKLDKYHAGLQQACYNLLGYIASTQNIPCLNDPILLYNHEYMELDAISVHNLDIFSKDPKRNSVFKTLNRTQSRLGERLLYQRLMHPITNALEINARLNHVELWIREAIIAQQAKHHLSHISDLERIITRIAMGKEHPKDLAMLHKSLRHLQELGSLLKGVIHGGFDESAGSKGSMSGRSSPAGLTVINEFDKCMIMLNQELLDNFFSSIDEEGNLRTTINANFQQLLAEKEKIIANMQELMLVYTEVHNLPIKLKENDQIGWFLEITNTYTKDIPNNFIHRQRLSNLSRFTTAELINLERELLAKHVELNAVRTQLLQQVFAILSSNKQWFYAIAKQVAALDVAISLASLAKEFEFSKPIITSKLGYKVERLKHILLLDHYNLVSNDCNLQQEIWLITGPNMAGKSTFLRQNAIAVLLAQIGSFVPASYMEFSVVDKLFARIGAYDDLLKGKSTFMVEMLELSNILSNATPNSFIIIDELGRGTAIKDGLSVAAAAIEYISKEIFARTLIATHYQELINLLQVNIACKKMVIAGDALHTKSQNLLDNMSDNTSYNALLDRGEGPSSSNDDNDHDKAVDSNVYKHGDLQFTYKIADGVADGSLGIFIATKAGIPLSVVDRAKTIFKSLS